MKEEVRRKNAEVPNAEASEETAALTAAVPELPSPNNVAAVYDRRIHLPSLPPSPEKGHSSDGHRPPLHLEGAARNPRRLTRSEAQLKRWREIRAGKRPHPDKVRAAVPSANPLFDLPEEKRSELYTWLQRQPSEEAITQWLADEGLPHITYLQAKDFFIDEGQNQACKRMEWAAMAATSVIRMAEKCNVKFSKAILHELAQQTFKAVSSSNMEPGIATKLGTLFLRARSDDRAEKMQKLKRKQLRNELRGEINHALDHLADEIGKRPGAKKVFEALRRELAEERS
jgi:hypothetical protein